MRILIVAFVATVALGSSSAASAQLMSGNEGSSGAAAVPVGTNSSYGMNVHQSTWEDRYDLAIMLLKKKVDRVTREDGGNLTAEHLASLQAELDTVNRQFGLKPGMARKASFPG